MALSLATSIELDHINAFSYTAIQEKNVTSDPTWQSSWPKFTGWKKQLEIVEGSTYYTFS